MHKDKDSFVGYGKNFQESVARLMMEDRPFCDQIEEVLELEFFDSSYLRAFVEIILDYREKYEQHPHFATLHTEIKKGRHISIGWYNGCAGICGKHGYFGVGIGISSGCFVFWFYFVNLVV